MMRPVAATGIEPLDDVLQGGLPIGAISEMVGPECSGRTSVALSFLAQMTQAGKICCWIDVANTFDPASAAAIGVDLTRLLWVRCGVAQTRVQRDARNFVLPEKYLIPSPHKKGLHGGGFGPHPRREANGLSEAVTGLLRPEAIAPRCAEPQRRVRQKQETFEAQYRHTSTTGVRSPHPSKPWSRIEQALRSTDLLLQSGGFASCAESGAVAELSSVSERLHRIQRILPHIGSSQQHMEGFLSDLERISGFCKDLLAAVAPLEAM
jgi:hypothetical protein